MRARRSNSSPHSSLGFVASKFRLLRGLPFRFSLNDHGPQHYIAALTPRGTPNEFGDAHLIPAT